MFGMFVRSFEMIVGFWRFFGVLAGDVWMFCGSGLCFLMDLGHVGMYM